MEKFIYPEEFVGKVKKEYPTWRELHSALDNGAEIVGRYLQDASPRGLDPVRVMTFIDEGRVDEIRAAAEHIVRRKALYTEWSSIFPLPVYTA